MRRVLQLLGVADATGRSALDERVMALPVRGGLADGGLRVSGARNDDGVLSITANSDGLSPEELFIAALLHGNDMCAELMEVMDREVRSEEHTSELQSLMRISYAVFCLKQKNTRHERK